MAQQFKEYLDKETYLLFEEDGEKFRFSSNNPSVQKWCESVKNKKVKRDAVKFVVKAAKDYMKNPQKFLQQNPKNQERAEIKASPNGIKTWQTDPISSLNLYCQQNGLNLPKYQTIDVEQSCGTQIVIVQMTTPQGKKIQKSASNSKEAKRMLALSYAKDELKVEALQDREKSTDHKTAVQEKSESAIKKFWESASEEDKNIMGDLYQAYRNQFGRKRTLEEFADHTIKEYRIGVAVAFYDDKDGCSQPILQDSEGKTDLEVLQMMVEDVKDIKSYEARERIAHAKEKQNAKKKITDKIGTFRLVSKEYTDEDHRSYIIERNDGVQYRLTVEYKDIRSGRLHKDRYGNIFSRENDKPMRVLKASYEIPNTAEKFEFESSVKPDVAQERPQSVDKNFAHNLKMARLSKSQEEQTEKLWQMLVAVNDPIIKSEQRKPQLTKSSSQYE